MRRWKFLATSLIRELRRRNVFRVGVLYLVAGWFLLQVADVLFGLLEVPGWGLRLVLGLLILGFPLVLVFAWVFELTPEGIKRESEIDRSQSITAATGNKLNIAIVSLLAAAVTLLALELLDDDDRRAREGVGSVRQASQVSTDTHEDRRQSIAVLPFVNMSGDPDNEYFSDGISEELLNVLVKVDGLTVASRTSSFAFKGKDVSVPDIAGQLKVDHVLEGSVRKAGNTVRITAQLIDVRSDRHIWSETYDRELEDVFAIQDDISLRIVEALKIALGAETATAMSTAGHPTDNLDAYELYLQGRYFWQRRGGDNIRKAIALFEQAIEIDPVFARAWSSLAAAYITLPVYTGQGEEPYFKRAEEAARKALDFDDSLAEAYAVLGDVTRLEFRWAEAESYYLAAVEREPRDATSRLWYGEFLTQVGRFEDATEQSELAYRLDPLSPGANTNLAGNYAILGRDAEALKHAAIAWDLGHPFGKMFEGNIELRRGQYDEAAAAFELFTEAIGVPGTMMAGYVRARRDPSYRDEFIEMLDGVADQRQPDAVLDINLGLGRLDEAFAIAERRFDEFEANAWILIWHNEGSAFRRDPRFIDLVERLRLVEYWRDGNWPDWCSRKGDSVVCR